MKSKISLNLYACLGGNRKLWQNTKVVAVELDPKIAEVYKQLYPQDEVIIADAHQFLLENYGDFDFIWSSPPCPTHSKMQKFTRHKVTRYPDMALYQEIIFLKDFLSSKYKGKWVIENVIPYYKPLICPTSIIGRHLFWANFYIGQFNYPKPPKDFINGCNVEASNKLKDWLDIHYEGNLYVKGNKDPAQVLRNCIHPKLGNYIYEQAFKETTLF